MLDSSARNSYQVGCRFRQPATQIVGFIFASLFSVGREAACVRLVGCVLSRCHHISHPGQEEAPTLVAWLCPFPASTSFCPNRPEKTELARVENSVFNRKSGI